MAGTAVWQCRAQSQPLWTGSTSGCLKLNSTYTPPRVTSDIYALQQRLREFSTSPDLRRASHKLPLSSELMIFNVEAMASAAVPIYWLMALEEVSWLQGFFWTVRIGLSQTVRKSFCFPQRMAKPTPLPLSLLEDSTVLLRSVASGIYRLIIDAFPIAWHRLLTALPGFSFSKKETKASFLSLFCWWHNCGAREILHDNFCRQHHPIPKPSLRLANISSTSNSNIGE